MRKYFANLTSFILLSFFSTSLFSATKIGQTITFNSIASSRVGGTYTPLATASSGLSVTITVDSSSRSICSIISGKVTFSAVGTCTLNAS